MYLVEQKNLPLSVADSIANPRRRLIHTCVYFFRHVQKPRLALYYLDQTGTITDFMDSLLLLFLYLFGIALLL